MKRVEASKEHKVVAAYGPRVSENKITTTSIVIPKGIVFADSPISVRRKAGAFMTAFIAINENETMEVTIPRLSELEASMVDHPDGEVHHVALETVEGCFADCLRTLYQMAGLEFPTTFEPTIEASRLRDALKD